MIKLMIYGVLIFAGCLTFLLPGSAMAQPKVCGDVTGEGVVNVMDLARLIQHVFVNAPYPGDQAECDGHTGLTALDVYYLVNYLFCQGPAPVCPATLPECVPEPDADYRLIYENIVPASASIHVAELNFAMSRRVNAVSLPILIRVDGQKPLSLVAQSNEAGWTYSGNSISTDSGVVVFYGFGQCFGNDTCLSIATITIGVSPQPSPQIVTIDLVPYRNTDPMIIDDNGTCQLPILIGAAIPECNVGTICDGSYSDPVFTICPAGDAIFEVMLRDALGNPVAGDSSVYIDLISCDGVQTCPPSGSITRLYPYNRSDFDGVIRFAVPAGGCNTACVAEIKAPCGTIASVPVRSFDVNGDFGVSLLTDLVGNECNNYDGVPGIQAEDQALLYAHTGHHCGLSPCERFDATFSLQPGNNLTPGQIVELSLALQNNNFEPCFIGAINFYSSGFGSGSNQSLIQSYSYNTSLLPGAVDTVTVPYVVPGEGHGCLSVEFTSDCCQATTVLAECAQSTIHCGNAAGNCYEIHIDLDGGQVQAIVFRDYLAAGWFKQIMYLPALPVISADSVVYRICTPEEANLGDDSRVFVEVWYDQFGLDIETFESQVFVTPRTGDADGNCLVSISDCVYVINYIFAGGGAPSPCQSADVDCNGIVNISDVVYLINFTFAGGPAPCVPDDSTPVPTCL